MPKGVVVVRGAELSFSADGTGPNVIWGHGLSQTMDIEQTLGLLDWTKVEARVTRYDARGHGLSETTANLTDYSWGELARDQLELAKQLSIGGYIAAGASMGCGTALHAAVHSPEQIAGLILVIPPTAWESRTSQTSQWDQLARVIENDGVEAVITARSSVAPPDPFVDDDSYRHRQAIATRSWNPMRLAHVMRGATKADLPDRKLIRSITAPALILAWTGDPTHPVSTAYELADLLPTVDIHLASTKAELETWTELVGNFIRYHPTVPAEAISTGG